MGGDGGGGGGGGEFLVNLAGHTPVGLAEMGTALSVWLKWAQPLPAGSGRRLCTDCVVRAGPRRRFPL